MDVENVGILSQHCMAPQSRRTRFEYVIYSFIHSCIHMPTNYRSGASSYIFPLMFYVDPNFGRQR